MPVLTPVSDMLSLLHDVKGIAEKHRLTSLEKQIASTENLSAERLINVAVFGQFKAGKSSLLNSIVGKQVLPTGVIPVTSAITRLYYGRKERAFITFNNGDNKEIRLDDIGEYITELKNPGNAKSVSLANIEMPGMEPYKGLCFVDTPGVGSIFLNNTRTAQDWSAEAGIALVCISAERPLSEFDVKLIREIDGYSYKLVCLLTKADLFTPGQMSEINEFVQTSLKKEIGKSIGVYGYSVRQNLQAYKKALFEGILNPLLLRFDREMKNILHHKILTVAASCLNYVDIALKTSKKTDEEKQELKNRIFDEKVSADLIRQELNLIAENSKTLVREAVYKLLEPYVAGLISEMNAEFTVRFSSWKGNLHQLTEQCEAWIKTALTTHLKTVADKERKPIDGIMDRVNAHFTFYCRSLRERLSDNVSRVLGTRLATEDWSPEYKHIRHPSISVYRAFDSHLDLLWFLFPMFLFRRMFRRHFARQIPYEVEKNIYRLTSDITGIINGQTDRNKKETIKYILTELSTIEQALSGRQSDSDEYLRTAEELRQKIRLLTGRDQE